MRFILNLLFILLILLILLGITGVFLPNTFNVHTSTYIDAKKELVHNQINIIDRWQHWWEMSAVDSTLLIEIGDIQYGPGANFRYSGIESTTDSGIIEITNSEKNNIDIVISSENMMINGYFELIDTADGCKLDLYLTDDSLSYLERYFLFLFGEDNLNLWRNSLASLKQYCEDIKIGHFGPIRKLTIPARKIVTITDSCSYSELGDEMLQMNKRLDWYRRYRKVDSIGYPFTIYHDISDTANMVIEVGYSVEEKFRSLMNVKYKETDTIFALTTDFYGNSNYIKYAYKAVYDYAEKKQKIISGASWEEYIISHETEPDTLKWLTKVYLPIQ